MPPTSALIAGAGPVGLATAIELARRGIEPRIVDPKDGPVDESRALVVNQRALELLGQCGAADVMLERGLKLRRLNVHDGGRRRFVVELSWIGGEHPYMLVLPQAQTERVLVGVLSELGIEVEWGTRLESIADSGAGECALESASGREEVTAELIVGADGANSTVREAVEIGFEGPSHPGVWGLADLLLAPGLPPDESQVFRDGRTIMALFPIGGERRFRLIGSSVDAIARLREQLEVEEVGWESTFRIAARQVGTYDRGRVFLAGDAAHVHSPLGGRGMNLGIEDAAWLAWLASEGRLSEYTDARLPVGREVVRVTDGMTRSLTDSKLLGDIGVRFIAPLATRLGPVQRRVAENFSGRGSPDPPWLAGG